MSDSIDTTLVCGFLGAGKTSQINRLIREGRLHNALFLVNDFGSINIDAELIESSEDSILRLNNGCACCGVAGNLSAQLSDIRRWVKPPERLVFEASGIARPRPLRELFAAARGYRLGESETLVDASSLQRHLADPAIADIVHDQIADVDLLRVNRMEWLDETKRPAVMARLREINPRARIVEDPLLEGGQPPNPVASGPAASGPVGAATVVLRQPVDVAAVVALLDAAAPALLRVKGMVRSREAGSPRQLIQLSGGRVRITATGPGNTEALVLIGHQGPTFDKLTAALERLSAPR